MVLGDVFSFIFLAFIAGFLLFKPTHELFVQWNALHPYLMGFIKVSLLATFGEILAGRIANKRYKKPVGVVYRFIVWGILGMIFVFIFEVFYSGTKSLLDKGLFPYRESGIKFFQAFYSSLLMNLFFAPTFMAFHRITDRFIDLGEGRLKKILSLKIDSVVGSIDWSNFVSFVVLKTIPFFWIPAHTITFLLPSTYRVLMAAFLSVFLGVMLSIRKRR